MSSDEENNFENNDDNDEEVEHTNEDEDNNNNNNNATEDEDKNEDLQHSKKKKKTQIIEEGEEESSFESFGLDPRLLKAIQKSNFHKPTIVQTAAIPLALKGKDILAKAKTGSGKTAAYLIPILQQLINEIEKNNDQTRRGLRVLILVPSAELSAQVYQQIKQLTIYLTSITFFPLTRAIPIELQKTRLAEMPDIVISTPSQLIPHLRNKDINLKDYPGLGWVVLDEADLLMSYGYEDDLKEIASHLPKAGCQAFLMSATLSSGNEEESLDSLKDLILSNPAILKLEEAELRDKDFLQQFTISCSEEDKFLVLFVLIKLRLIRGKIIFFVNEIDRCYRLKLFFERFSIKAAVLNSELPQVSRNHIIMEFNKGVFDYLIATDENLFNTNQKQGKRKKDKEYLVARGVDFKFVKAVVNFDLPPTKEAYVHRIGRTARGGTKGLALSFVTPRNDSLIKEIQGHVEAEGYEMKPFAFNMNAIEGFRYRVEDVSRSVTKVAIREARIKELKAEIFNSSKLKAHFEDNPQDLAVLQHDQTLQQSKVQPHLRVVPDYLLKDVKKKGIVAKVQSNAPTKRKWEPKKSSKQSDPLKTFSFKKRKTD